PDQPLQGRGHQLAVLAQQPAVWTEEQGGAVEGAAVAFDHTDDKMKPVAVGGGPDDLGSLAGHIDGALEIAAELLTSFGRAHTHPGPEGKSFRVSGDEGFGEQDKLCALAGGVGGQVLELGQRSLDVEDDGSGLNDGGT